MSRRQSEAVPELKGPVRITLPATVANDVGALKQTITDIAERIGCRACFSGADCTFRIERELVVDGPKQIRSTARLFSTDPDGDPVVPLGRTVTVSMPHAVGQNLDQVLKVVDQIANRIKGWPGHLACFSGFDIAFRREISLVTLDQDLNVNTFGPAFGG